MNRLNEIAKLITKGEIRGFEKGKLEERERIMKIIDKRKIFLKGIVEQGKCVGNRIDELTNLKQQLQKEICANCGETKEEHIDFMKGFGSKGLTCPHRKSMKFRQKEIGGIEKC